MFIDNSQQYTHNGIKVKLNRRRLFSRKFENQQGIVHLLLLIILLGGMITGVYLVTSGNPLKLFSKAFDKKETRSIDSLDIDEEKKPEFVQGEVLIKLKTPLGKLKFKSNIQSLDVEKQAIPFSSLDSSSLPPVLATLNSKYQIKTIEKVFKGTQSPEQELAKFKTKFSQGISEGKRKIEEQAALRNDLSRIYKLSFENNKIPVEQIILSSINNPEVEYTEPNYIYRIDQITPTPIPTLSPTIPTSPVAANDPYFLDPNPLAQERTQDLIQGGWNPTKGDSSPLDYQWNLKKIGFPQAWNYVDINNSITVAVIDTGVDRNHEDLKDNMWVNNKEMPGNAIDDDGNGYVDDYYGQDAAIYCEIYEVQDVTGDRRCNTVHYPDNDPMDDYFIVTYGWKYQSGGGHGTHVAGVIAGKTNNSLGLAGMGGMGGVKIMALRGLGVEGGGYNSQLAELIRYAANNGANVINMSWGSDRASQTISEALDYAASLNVVLVASSGNSGSNQVSFPSSHPKVISVGATNEQDDRSSYSDYGSQLDLTAPGGNSSSGTNPRSILSLRGYRTDIYCQNGGPSWCYWQGEYDSTRHSPEVINDKYIRAAGTSMAAPHVAALAALILGKNPSLKADQVETIMEYSAQDLGAIGKDNNFGFGRINAEKALKEFSLNPPPAAIISEPYDQEHLYTGTFEIRGSLLSNQLQSFRLEYSLVSDQKSWSSEGIKLATVGSNGIENGLLGTWNSGNLEEKYYLRLTALDKEGRERSNQIIIELVNKSIKVGWPVKIGTPENFFASPIIADLNADGKKEIVVSQLENITSYQENGSTLPNWPVTLAGKLCGYIGVYYCYYRDNIVTVGDVDPQFPGKEVILNDLTGSFPYSVTSLIKVIHTDGSTININGFKTQGILADVDGDKVDEILATRREGNPLNWNLYALKVTGQSVVGFPVQFYQGNGLEQPSGPSIFKIGDINGDNKEDVVIATLTRNQDEKSKIIAISGNGQVIWVKELPTAARYQDPKLILGDIDLDGKKDVVFYDTYSLNQSPWQSCKIYIWKGDGNNLLSTTPLDVCGSSDVSWVNASLYLSNIEGDNRPEIIIVTTNKFTVIQYNGQITVKDLPNLKVLPMGNDVVIGDLDNNNSKEFFVNGGVYMLPYGQWPQTTNLMISLLEYSKGNFVEKSTWPKSVIADLYALGTKSYFQHSALADLDNDGKSEIILQYCLQRKNGCYLYALKEPGNIGQMDWPQYLHDERHTGSYNTEIPTPSPTPTPIPTPTPASVKVSFKDTSGKPISQIACAACWNGSGGYTKIEQCQQTGTEVVITKPALCNTYNPVLGVHLPGGNRTEVTNVSANPTSSFKTYMNQYFGWSDIKTWTEGERTLTLTVKPAQMWTPSPKPTPATSSCTACSADADKSGFVNTGDFSLIKACQSKPATGACANADVNGDKQINAGDITCWQAHLGKQCSTPSPTPAVFTCTACAADINKDGWVNILDFSKLSGCYFKDATGDCKAADINPDGKVNAKDYACLVSKYNKKC